MHHARLRGREWSASWHSAVDDDVRVALGAGRGSHPAPPVVAAADTRRWPARNRSGGRAGPELCRRRARSHGYFAATRTEASPTTGGDSRRTRALAVATDHSPGPSP